MPLFYITGISGAGKSHIKNELTAHGLIAYDGDENGITTWIGKVTKVKAFRPKEIEGRTAAWYSHHDWVMSATRLLELSQQNKGRNIYICGTASNRYELWNMFDRVFCLTIDEQTLRHRLANRTGNEFGKAPDELTNILSWHKSSENEDQAMGAFMIDATKPANEVAEDIIKICEMGVNTAI
jgi:gluconate kinase